MKDGNGNFVKSKQQKTQDAPNCFMEKLCTILFCF